MSQEQQKRSRPIATTPDISLDNILQTANGKSLQLLLPELTSKVTAFKSALTKIIHSDIQLDMSTGIGVQQACDKLDKLQEKLNKHANDADSIRKKALLVEDTTFIRLTIKSSAYLEILTSLDGVDLQLKPYFGKPNTPASDLKLLMDEMVAEVIKTAEMFVSEAKNHFVALATTGNPPQENRTVH